MKPQTTHPLGKPQTDRTPPEQSGKKASHPSTKPEAVFGVDPKLWL